MFIVFTVVNSFYRTIFFEKNKLKGGELIGQKYGTLFEVQHGKLVASSLATLENSATGSSLVSEGNSLIVIQSQCQITDNCDTVKKKKKKILQRLHGLLF